MWKVFAKPFIISVNIFFLCVFFFWKVWISFAKALIMSWLVLKQLCFRNFFSVCFIFSKSFRMYHIYSECSKYDIFMKCYMLRSHNCLCILLDFINKKQNLWRHFIEKLTKVLGEIQQIIAMVFKILTSLKQVLWILVLVDKTKCRSESYFM